MSTRENKELVRQLFEEWNAINGDVAKLRSLYEKYYISDFIHHDPVRGDETSEQRNQYMTMWLTTFPDTRWSIDDMLAEGDMVATRYKMRFTHTRKFIGVAPTGKQIVNEGAYIHKIRGGKVVEIWDFPNTVGIVDQIGALFPRHR